jgi:hypothetical protein
LGGVSNALQPRRLYWVHLSWVALAIMYCLTTFWVFWGYQTIEWTPHRLILVLSAPGLTYVFSSILVPADSSSVESWRDYFFSVRPRLFAGGFAMILSIIFGDQALAGVSFAHPSQTGLYGLLAIFALGAVSERPWVHNVLALVPPLIIVGILVVLAQPDWSAP